MTAYAPPLAPSDEAPLPLPLADADAGALMGQADRDRRRQRQLAAMAVVAVAGFGLLYYWPSATRLASLREQISHGARQLTADHARVALLPQVQQQADRLDRELAPMSPLGPDEGVGAFMRELNVAAERNGLARLTWTPGEPVITGNLGRRTMRVQFRGRYVEVFSFLKYVEQSSRALTVGELTLRPQARDPADVDAAQNLDVDLTLHLHFRAGA